MKAGILTYHRAINYGAVLQAYALEKVICRLGHECELIDYRNPFIEASYSPVRMRTAQGIRKLKCVFPSNAIRKKKMEKFHGFLSRFCTSSEAVLTDSDFLLLRDRYDVVIAGSDQIWNLELSGEDYKYFLESFDQSVRKCSYAASVSAAENERSGEEINRILTDLRQFDAVSVREKSAEKYLKSIGLETDIEVVLDPTLLLSEEEWRAVMAQDKIPGIPDRYLLAYFVSNKKNNCKTARRLAERLGLKAVLINYSTEFEFGFHNLMTAAPEQFLRLIDDADYFITDSFHGVAFSVIFRKNFVYRLNFSSPEKNDRIETLTRALKIFDRNYEAMCSGQNWKDIDNWDEIIERLSVLKQHSVNYLTQKVLI